MVRIFQLIAFISEYNPAIQLELYFCLRLGMVPIVNQHRIRQACVTPIISNASHTKLIKFFNPFPCLSDTLPNFAPILGNVTPFTARCYNADVLRWLRRSGLQMA